MFRTERGAVVPAVTAEQMREIDRVAVDVFGLGILQMIWICLVSTQVRRTSSGTGG